LSKSPQAYSRRHIDGNIEKYNSAKKFLQPLSVEDEELHISIEEDVDSS
jgi:hypothetical protein